MKSNRQLLPLLIAVMAVIFTFSCSGAKPDATPTVTVEPTKEATAQPTVKPTGPANEVLVPGSADSVNSSPEPDKAVNIEFILDASGSMLERVGGKTKLEIAKEVVSGLVQALPNNVNVGLRAYGHRIPEGDKARSCEDIQLLQPLGEGDANKFTQQIKGIQARGWTPMGKSIELAAQDVSGKSQNVNNVVLLSDGQETCDGNPIEVAQKVKEGPAGLTVHTVGFAINEETRKELQEIARVSGGTYNEADDADGLLKAVDKALLAARSGTFLRGEILGEDNRRVSASVLLQEPKTGRKLQEFRSWVDAPVAPGVYDVIVGTAPRVLYSGVQVQAHTRTILKLGTGALRMELIDSTGQPVKAAAHLKDRKTGATLRTFFTWYNQPALPGSYDVEIETNPAVVRRNIGVTAGKLTVAQLGRGSLRVDVAGLGGIRPNWEIELREPDTDQVVYRSFTGREQSLMGGTYQMVILGSPQIRSEVKIAPGESKVIKFETGLLRVELTDGSGTRATAPVSLVNGPDKEAGRFSSWEDVYPLPGNYQLILNTQPEIRRDVQVSATQPTILKLRAP